MRRCIPLLCLSFGLVFMSGEFGEIWAQVRPRLPYSTRAGQYRLPQMQMPRPMTKNIDYDISTADSVKVRLAEPSFEFDEKGKIRIYSAEEKKALKGDDPAEQKLAGFKAKFSDLRVGDVVQVFLSKPKGAPAPKAKEEGDKPKDATAWVSAGQLSGTVTKVQEGSLSVRVATMVMSQPGQGKQQPNGGGNRVVIEPARGQATLIVVQTRGPEQEEKGARPKKKGKANN